jgi:uncharacterized protein with PIN domain
MIIHLHGDLARLLPRHLRGQERIEAPLSRRASIKDLIESYDVPHTEVGRLTVAGRELSFAHIVGEEETIEVYPQVAPVDPLRPTLLRPQPLSHIAFTVDQNVGKLAMLLRLAGFDTLYHHGISDPELAELNSASGRILLTKDKDLLKRKKVEFGRLVREILPERQLAEVVTLFGLKGEARPFSRCLRCNDGILEPVEKELILHLLEPLTIKYYDHFNRCNRCGRIFWAGTHREKMAKLLDRLGLLR